MSGEYDVNLRYGVDTTMNLSGKVAVVTGGLGGIAMASNQMLLEKGASLALLYPPFEADKVDSARAALAGQVQFICCDVTDPADVEQAWEAWIKGVANVDARAKLLLRAAFEVGVEAGKQNRE